MATKALTNPEAETEIRRLEKQYERDVNEGAFDRIVKSFYTEDARVIPPNAPAVEGRDALADLFEKLGAQYSDVKIHASRVVASGDIAVAEGSFEGKLRLPDGTTRPDRGTFVEVYRKEPDGSWKCFLDTFNSVTGD